MKNSNYINAASVSDIHFKHPRNPTKRIVANLRETFKDDAYFASLDILFIAGDVFDRLVSLPDSDVFFVDAWFCNLLWLCEKHDVMLRVLEGTDSHDRRQSGRIMNVLEMTGYKVDLKYIDTICVEYNERLDKNILYIPDNYGLGCEDNLKDVREILQAKGLTKFDIGCFHGQFDYQLPPAAKADAHNSEIYQSLCTGFIVIGHVHIHTRKGKILAQGSYDRLTHGEEAPKGHLNIRLHKDNRLNVAFIENKNAMKFVTVDCSMMDVEQAWKFIQLSIKDLPPGSHVRIKVDGDSPLNNGLSVLFNTYADFVWSKQIADKEESLVVETQLGDDDEIYRPIEITATNIKQLLMDRFSNQTMGLSQNLTAMAIEKINEVL